MHPKVLTWGGRGRRRVRVVWQGAQSRLLGRGEVVVELIHNFGYESKTFKFLNRSPVRRA